MNREIRFRAWDNVAKRWLHDGDSDMLLMDLDGSTYRCSTDSCETPVRETINTPTLSQFTGLKDKNGKEIYEGDLVRMNIEKEYGYRGWGVYEIVFNSHEFAIKPLYFSDSLSLFFGIGKIYGNNIQSIWKKDILEIIGNIYENPEFLKA